MLKTYFLIKEPCDQNETNLAKPLLQSLKKKNQQPQSKCLHRRGHKRMMQSHILSLIFYVSPKDVIYRLSETKISNIKWKFSYWLEFYFTLLVTNTKVQDSILVFRFWKWVKLILTQGGCLHFFFSCGQKYHIHKKSLNFTIIIAIVVYCYLPLPTLLPFPPPCCLHTC